ncbi:uncharacterized protein STEHIDRAFT_145701 [Stereum hirsutum FP-91666 SS1]|uniref:uncharacterized protein n=1 Tax=Stereum hirsutum (strain FP-91666) TaxID=721885 RepID=UPI000440EB14|nr:uncharacterized protein STEHIDRAFT_145701 [Stereum hirsutum FP-91666 SS1]EIM88891.1 hypothetical protein STEHIDRAFT_145701 [Stereum hirsutum FP-91666 SS1]
MAALSLSKATIISVGIACILYGFSLFMFGFTLWVLLHHRAANEINRVMVSVACILFLLSTAHISALMRHVIEGLLDHASPEEWFLDESSATFILKLVLYALQTMTGDGVLIYRCYVVWQNRKMVVVVPILLFLGFGGTSFTGFWAYAVHHPGPLGHILLVLSACFSLLNNVICTSLLAYRLYKLNSYLLPGPGPNSIRPSTRTRRSLIPMMFAIIDAGVLYSATLLTTLICLFLYTNVLAIMLEITVPLIAITFYGVIIRVGMEKAASTGRPFLSSSEDRNTVDTMEEHGVLSTIMYLPEALERGAGEKTDEGSIPESESS